VAGLWFEEFADGMRFEHEARRTVTTYDNMHFSLMTMNPQPLHIDHDFAAQSEWGKPLVNSLFTLGLLIGMSVGDTTQGTTLGNLGMTDVRFPKPVFEGDTLRAETMVIGVRPSASRPGQGIVTFRHEMLNQSDDVVATCERAALMLSRPDA
jgi:acyl dehydratase